MSPDDKPRLGLGSERASETQPERVFAPFHRNVVPLFQQVGGGGVHRIYHPIFARHSLQLKAFSPINRKISFPNGGDLGRLSPNHMSLQYFEPLLLLSRADLYLAIT